MFGFGVGEVIVVVVLVIVAGYALRRGMGKRVAEGAEDEFGRLVRRWEKARAVEQLERAVRENWSNRTALQLNFGQCGQAINELEEIAVAVRNAIKKSRARLKELEWAVRNPEALEDSKSMLEVARIKIEPTRAGISALEAIKDGISQAMTVASELHKQVGNRLEVLNTTAHFEELQVAPLARLDSTASQLSTIAGSVEVPRATDRLARARSDILDKVAVLNIRLGAQAPHSAEFTDDQLAERIKAIRTAG